MQKRKSAVSSIAKLISGIVRSPLLWGLAATAGFFVFLSHAATKGLLGDATYKFLFRYCAKDPINQCEMAAFFVGLAALLIKRQEVREQLAWLKQSLLGPQPAGGQTADDCEGLLAQLDQAPARQQQSYLVQRLRAALLFVRRKGSAEELSQELKYLGELDEARAYGSFAFVRVIIWAIPILGFLGTVVGITGAIASLDPRALEQSMNGVIEKLGVAFDTTALALVLSMVLMFVQFAIDRKEQQLLAGVEQVADEELSARFLQHKTGGHPEVAAVRRMSEALLEATAELVERQAELWRGSIAAAQEKWSHTLTDAQGQVEAGLGRAVSQALETHARHMAVVGQDLARHTHEHWAGMQQAMSENLLAMQQQQEQLLRQGQVLHEVAEATGQVARLEETLNRNLASLAGSHNFEETVERLAAVIHLLNARLSHLPPEREGKAGRAA
jgi:biopolymer transport protein ExbB/TolQ